MLLPLAMRLLQDDSSDVRLAVIGHLGLLIEMVGMDRLLAALLPAIDDLASDSQWRVRHAIIAHFPLLAAHISSSNFDSRLLPVLRTALRDAVSAVRDEAAAVLARLYDHAWHDSTLLALLLGQARNPNYLYRISVLHVIEKVLLTYLTHNL